MNLNVLDFDLCERHLVESKIFCSQPKLLLKLSSVFAEIAHHPYQGVVSSVFTEITHHPFEGVVEFKFYQNHFDNK